ncbi:hypothetical protein DFR24_1498 [Panacagrimonas perspica]|uniref:Uncharacterized protein n=1 Tax=Panacagrimonas perspica TaxID=381431 RepID=A0A4R7PFG6_9GAMM|nr:hypothetical protein [Panacagrimonas perspica]TDU32110.1 hypothetical protein DFR24_1498 [Panacagrimonas perspica]THD01334.1 hypothetical protein B1810_20345 [Panacagrimonas perspica]
MASSAHMRGPFPIPLHMLARDIALVAGSFAALVWSHHLQDARHGAATFVACLAGVMLPVSGYLVHEWGHLAGCLLSRSVVHFPPTPLALLLFRYDTGVNDRRQFLAMFWGGFVASVFIVALYFVLLDGRYLADRIALSLTTLGVLATFVLEIPEGWGVYRGKPLPRGAAFVNEKAS